MSKLQMVVFSFTAVVLIAEIAQTVQARPGFLGLSSADIFVSSSSRQLLSAEPLLRDAESVNSSEKDRKMNSDEELDAVCKEGETCDDRRLLTASVDYENYGPNNPITDPPH